MGRLINLLMEIKFLVSFMKKTGSASPLVDFLIVLHVPVMWLRHPLG